jgi:putative flippase GtrA
MNEEETKKLFDYLEFLTFLVFASLSLNISLVSDYYLLPGAPSWERILIKSVNIILELIVLFYGIKLSFETITKKKVD